MTKILRTKKEIALIGAPIVTGVSTAQGITLRRGITSGAAVIAGTNHRIALIDATAVAQTPSRTPGCAMGIHAVGRTGIVLRTSRRADGRRTSVQTDTTDIAGVSSAGRIAERIERTAQGIAPVGASAAARVDDARLCV